jgi:hypothetical protein
MHGVLNIDENKNYLHSLIKIYKTNLLSLINLWLDHNYYKQTKCYGIVKNFFLKN